MQASRAGVTQLAECLLPKQNVAGSNPVSRSTSAVLTCGSRVSGSLRVSEAYSRRVAAGVDAPDYR